MTPRTLSAPPEGWGDYIEQAAIRMDLSPVIVEKDFWVCWILAILFQGEFEQELVFKGGTSLSKVFGVIDRFSEDIDLSLSPSFLGLPPAVTSRNQANKWMRQAETTCGIAVRDQVAPALEAKVAAILGPHPARWFEFVIDPMTHSPVLNFRYPATQTAGFEYLRRTVKLEFGSLTDQQPVGRHCVRPWVVDAFPNLFPNWTCDVVALDLQRSFWEKATILHAEYHRPDDKPSPDRYSRHYADSAALAQHPAVREALCNSTLRDRVVQWKSLFFGSAWANYELAKPGTFRLVPPRGRETALRSDYRAMRQMYRTEPRSFDAILTTLGELESTINQCADSPGGKTTGQP